MNRDMWHCDLACQVNLEALVPVVMFAGLALAVAVIWIFYVKWRRW
jgi:hypothetical protein